MKEFILFGVFVIFFLVLGSFAYFSSTTNHFSVSKITTITIAGDVMLGRSVMGHSMSIKNPRYPFEKIYPKIGTADLTFVNLENPIVKNCPFVDSGFKFCADPKMIEGLLFAGIDIVNLANNHIYNYGKDGFEQTKEYLKMNNIDYVGDGNFKVKNINGTTFGFLGFDFVTKEPTDNDYILVKKSANQVDQLIVGVHWGNEYSANSTLHQKEIAKKLIENGADVIAGHHPHWVQENDHINGKPVYYSLGNLVFDQMWSDETRKGLVVNLKFTDGNLLNEEKIPIYIKEFAQPQWAGN